MPANDYKVVVCRDGTLPARSASHPAPRSERRETRGYLVFKRRAVPFIHPSSHPSPGVGDGTRPREISFHSDHISTTPASREWQPKQGIACTKIILLELGISKNHLHALSPTLKSFPGDRGGAGSCKRLFVRGPPGARQGSGVLATQEAGPSHAGIATWPGRRFFNSHKGKRTSCGRPDRTRQPAPLPCLRPASMRDLVNR